MLHKQAAFSYLRDPLVPDFDGAGPRTVMDANCGLCAKGARWIARRDKQNAFKIIPLQSALGGALMRHYGLDPDDPASWLYLEDGQAYSSLDAFIRAGQRLGGWSRALVILRIIPKPLQDISYRFVARNRYRFFGRADLCAMPDPDVQKRLIL